MTNRDKIRQEIAAYIASKLIETEKLSSYEAKALNFLEDMRAHVGPLTEKQKSFFLKLAIEALPMTLRWGGQCIELTKEILEKIL
jgi:hypothetical protein